MYTSFLIGNRIHVKNEVLRQHVTAGNMLLHGNSSSFSPLPITKLVQISDNVL